MSGGIFMYVLYAIEDNNKVYLKAVEPAAVYTLDVEEAMKFEDDIEACSFLYMTGVELNLEVLK